MEKLIIEFGRYCISIQGISCFCNGNVLWQKAYGSSEGEVAYTIQETTDGGYIVGGIIGHSGAGEKDSLVLKLDINGNISWQKTYQGSAVNPFIIILILGKPEKACLHTIGQCYQQNGHPGI